MRIVKFFQVVVALPPVRGDAAAGFNIFLNKGGQFAARTILDYLDPEAPQFASLAFHGNRHCTLMFRPAASLAAVLIAQAKKSDFDLTGKLFALCVRIVPLRSFWCQLQAVL